MMYEKATKLPPFSTPTGIMFLLVWKMRQTIDFQKSRALIQALMSQQGAQDEQIKQVFEELRGAFFPFSSNQREAELKKMKEAMTHWVKQGPVVIQAQDDGKQSRKMASKLARGQQKLAVRIAQENQSQETAAFDKARRRRRDVS